MQQHLGPISSPAPPLSLLWLVVGKSAGTMWCFPHIHLEELVGDPRREFPIQHGHSGKMDHFKEQSSLHILGQVQKQWFATSPRK